MAIKEYSYKKDGEKYLSPHFKVKEFKNPKDPADSIKIDDQICPFLEQIFGHFNCKSITITSGYRSPGYSVFVGGKANDQHTQGRAVDFVCRWAGNGEIIPTKYILCYFQDTYGKTKFGAAKISDTATHLDFRPTGYYRGDEAKGFGNNISNNDFYAAFNVKKGDDAKYTKVAQSKPGAPDLPKKEDGYMVYKQTLVRTDGSKDKVDAINKDGRIFVPLTQSMRFFGLDKNYTVDYDDKSKEILFSKK